MNVVPHGGLALTPGDYTAASAGGDKSATGNGVVLFVQNAGEATRTVTLAVPQTVDGLAVISREVEVPAGDLGIVPLLDLYRDPANGLASWTYDAETSVTVAVVRIS